MSKPSLSFLSLILAFLLVPVLSFSIIHESSSIQRQEEEEEKDNSHVSSSLRGGSGSALNVDKDVLDLNVISSSPSSSETISTDSSSSLSTITTMNKQRSLTEIAHVDDEIDAEAHKKLDTFIDSVGAHAAASVCSVIAVVVSVHLMYRHLQHYSRPLLQRQIIRIVMIVPVYAFCSALSLGFDHYAPYINALRDIYEAL